MDELLDKAWRDIEETLPDNIYRRYLRELAQYGTTRVK